MNNHNRVIIDKKFIKKTLFKKEDIALSLSRFIDNSIKVRQEITTKKNPCRIKISIFENLIVVNDNSGGIRSHITDKDLFKIGNDSKSGIGMKKSLCRLGNKIDIISNRKDCSRKFSMDLDDDGEELLSIEQPINYDCNIEDGTTIYVTNLEDKVFKEIQAIGFEKKIIKSIGRMYTKFINKEKLIIKLNNYIINEVNVDAEYINSCLLLDKYNVDLYKGSRESPGMDIFINDYMIYNRVKNKEVRWNFLNEAKHTYLDCIVEVNYSGSRESFETEKDELFKKIIDFIKDNKVHFKSKTITIQYEMQIGKVEELKDYFGEDTAKGVGIRAFNKLYEDYIWMKNKK
ncbi:ATP-binding protein [Clostridium botulinum]|uniref:ATP-binding protein n=1 Tax=Clostridium botulinum TaxID=1491 RepID=UPI0019671972|nr:ATP-binding protein [Clostridium botulinum]MBN1058127.1 hypothetical protein [Clostridium botulinum]MBN1061423.1 hypothetical protein [Clostridium botulinum]